MTNRNRARVAMSAWMGLLAVAWADPIAAAQEAPTYLVGDLDVVPWMATDELLLSLEPVQRELKLSEEQIARQSSILEGRLERLQRARRENREPEKLLAARDALFKEVDAAIRANLTPEQLTRLEEIQFQAQGPLAFARPAGGLRAKTPPPLLDRLKLTDDQVMRIKAIFEEGQPRIVEAARVPIALDSRNGPPTLEAIERLVDSPEFQAAKQKAREDARAARAALMGRIEDVLTAGQRDAYRQRLGTPFDLPRLAQGLGRDRKGDIRMVARAFGLGGGQRADPTFDPRVARPAYAGADRRPRVLFDEGHNNFHTAGGRYKPFAELIANDGYQVIPNREPFTRAALERGEILIIANALGGTETDEPAGAFTDAECDAIRDWVRDGGSLLLITDHAPFGPAAAALARRFGVDVSKGAVTSDEANSEKDSSSLVFSRQNHLLGDHPITRGRDDSERVNRIQTFTGTSLKGPEGSVLLYRLADTAVDRSFGDSKPVSAAGRCQGLALTFGKGRVVVLGEAGELSAQVIGFEGEKFGMNVPGIDNRQMALNLLHWLSGLLEPRPEALKKAG
jgi:hypothetical protein